MASSSAILALFSVPQLLKIDIVYPKWTNQTRAIILKMLHYSFHIYVFRHKYFKRTYFLSAITLRNFCTNRLGIATLQR